jgi:hypothetical protein
MCFGPAVFAAEIKSSRYISDCYAKVTPTGSGNLKISFQITGTGYMTDIGATKIELKTSGGTTVKTFRYTDPDYSNMMGENDVYYSSYITYSGVPGKSYYAIVTFYAGNDSGNDSTSYSAVSNSGDVVVGDLADITNNYQIVYFRIKNSKVADKVLFNQQLNQQRTFIMYLKDSNGNMFIFEEDLDNINYDFSGIKCSKTANSDIDIGWFLNVVKAKRELIDFDQSLFPNMITEKERNIDEVTSSHYYIWGPPSTISYSADIGGEHYQWLGYPYFEGYINDVPGSVHEHWTSTLKLAQSAYIDGELQDYHNAHFFRLVGSSDNNDEIIGTLAAGENTRLQSRHLGYTFLKSSQTNYAGAIWTSVGWIAKSSATFNAAYELIDNAISFFNGIDYNDEEQVTNDSLKVLEANTRADSYKVTDSSLSICCSHQSIDLSYDVYTLNDDLTPNYDTYAAINWKFDLEFNGSLDSEYDDTESVDYIVND